MSASIIYSILISVVSLIVLYLVIENAVRTGINNSIIGQMLEKKYGFQEEKKSFLDSDLDNDK